jgi:hypothetical protein
MVFMIFLAQRCPLRPRGALPLASRPYAEKPHGVDGVLVVCHMTKDYVAVSVSHPDFRGPKPGREIHQV